MIKLSPLTSETRIRYAGAFLLVGLSVVFFFFNGFTQDNIISDLSTEETFIPLIQFYPGVLILLWSMFNRWFFMAPAMVVSSGALFFSIVMMMVVFNHPEFFVNLVLSLIVLAGYGLTITSFVIYVRRWWINN